MKAFPLTPAALGPVAISPSSRNRGFFLPFWQRVRVTFRRESPARRGQQPSLQWNVCRNPKFLYSALWGFPPAETMKLFEGLGVPLKTERGNRVFPVSENARDFPGWSRSC